MTASDPSPETTLRELATACARSVQEAVGVPLDGTQDTLPILDHYLSQVGKDSPPEVLSLIAPMCGAYFGSLIGQHFPDARWHAPPEKYEEWRVEFSLCFLSFNPVGMILEAIMGEEQPGWRAHLHTFERDRDALQNALNRLGGVREEDFFRLGTRFEVIEVAYETLRGVAGTDTFYSAEVYAASLLSEQDDGRI